MARTDVFDTDFDTDAEETTPEAQEDNTVTETETTEAPAQTEADPHEDSIAEFKSAVQAAIDEADPTTGTAPSASIEAAVLAYRAITGGIKYKNLGKKWLQGEISAAINESRFQNAVTYNAVNERLLAGVPSAEPAATVDPKEAYGELVAAHITVLDYLRENVPAEAEGFEVPDTESALAEVEAYLDWEGTEDRDDEDKPELGDVAAAAVAILKGKKTRKARKASGVRASTYEGPRRSVAKHIESAFEGLESGSFLKIAEIANHTSEEYGDDHPSSGAIAAALFPRSGKDRDWDNLTPATDENGVKGAVAN